MMRRSFLFLLGVGVAKVSTDYLSIEQNKNNPPPAAFKTAWRQFENADRAPYPR